MGVGQGRRSGQASIAPHPTRQREKQCKEPKVINSACYTKDQNSCQCVTESEESLLFFFLPSSKYIKPLPTEEHLSTAQQLEEGLSMEDLLSNSNGKGGQLYHRNTHVYTNGAAGIKTRELIS